MAPRTNRSTAGPLVCLVDPLPDRNTPVGRCVDPSCGTRDPSETSTPGEVGTDYSGRLPRFAYLARRRSASIMRADSPSETTTPTKTPVIDRPVEEGVR